ncbi:MAG: hypothetical protein CVV22_08280 [Ignavibacteriae bacterium HGW-Ignavibacteriae-1]|jgi:hypothetical protein|nr:MAG: hypothetical protein CVV22_08280 [Ignavibacteriae bacterium HGW-Ignavibacteriae-1]
MIKLIIAFSIVILLGLTSCKDIINTEPNYRQELIFKVFDSVDSLSFLDFSEHDLGSMKVRSVINDFINITNQSDTMTITIYSVENTNKTGLFSYRFKETLPIDIAPKENIADKGKIEVVFIADSFVPGLYYDTLIINNNIDFQIPIKVQTRY